MFDDNSGIWEDYKISTVEDQQKFCVPLNRETEKIYYNQRIIIDNKVLTEPRTWTVSKINRVSPNGICRITLAQSSFDQHKDFIEKDENGRIIGMWADYYSSSIEPEQYDEDIPVITNVYSEIKFSGTKPVIKVGGSYRKYTVSFYKNDEQDDSIGVGNTWEFYIDDTLIDLNSDSCPIDVKIDSDYIIRVKFIGSEKYLGKILKMINKCGKIQSELQVEITNM